MVFQFILYGVNDQTRVMRYDSSSVVVGVSEEKSEDDYFVVRECNLLLEVLNDSLVRKKFLNKNPLLVFLDKQSTNLGVSLISLFDAKIDYSKE